ncbi:unnamed protein product [Chrysoparadoxa australica]
MSAVKAVKGSLSRASIQNAHVHAATITVLFHIPEQGMKQPELLTRGTTFCTPHPNTGKLAFFTPAHVAAPWKFPRYYPQDWLKFVEPQHCIYTLNARNLKMYSSDGTNDGHYFFGRVELHPTRDVAAFYLEDEDAALKDMKRKELKLEPVRLRDSPLMKGEFVDIAGFEVEDESEATFRDEVEIIVEGESAAERLETKNSLEGDLRRQYPLGMRAEVSLRTQNQVFARTRELLNDGMCGAPAIDGKKMCAGMVEGIARMPNEGEVMPPGYDKVAGHACLLEGPLLEQFLRRGVGEDALGKAWNMTHVRK